MTVPGLEDSELVLAGGKKVFTTMPCGTESRRPRRELFMAWRDCGLLDEKGKARTAYRVWREYFDLPLAR
jgi:hypothetical protein